jgi:predicted  nucleic acid-binding Zn-ribbon protein
MELPTDKLTEDDFQKEEKIDLISDVIKMVSELNEQRYHGDTILKTLTRFLGRTFIDKYEYDMKMREVVTLDTLDPLQRELDRINRSMEDYDMRINQYESEIGELKKDMKAINEKMNNKVGLEDIHQIQERQTTFATKDEVRTIDMRFSKYAKNEYLTELRSRVEILKENTEKLVQK